MTVKQPLPFAARFRPALLPAMRFAMICAVALLVAIGYRLTARGFAPIPRTAIALAILALPPAAVAGVAAYVLDILLPCRSAALRGLLLALAVVTAGLTASAGVFALQFRTTFPAEFDSIWTEAGFHQLAWTGIATTYLFALSGLRLYLPWGLVALIFATVYFAARPCPTLRAAGPSAKDAASDTQNPTSR